MHHDFLDKYSDRDSRIHRLDSRVKILFFFGLIIVAVSTPAEAFPAFGFYLLLLIVVWAASKVPLKHVALKSLVILPFVGMVSIFIPFLPGETGGSSFSITIENIEFDFARLLILWNIMVKAVIAVISLILLLATTGFPNLLKGFLSLKIPRVLVDMLSFLYRFIFVIIDESHRMLRSIRVRLFEPRTLLQARIIGDLLGTLFLRSFERGERVFLAMESRGGAANLSRSLNRRMTAGDIGFLAAGAAVISAVRIFAV